jgi:anti-sigma-K factor RskA
LTTSEHDDWREAAGLYVLGALARDDRARFEAHLESCADCAAEVRTLSGVTEALPYAVPQIDPPSRLRSRILNEIGTAPSVAPTAMAPPRARFPLAASGWLSAAALLLLTVALGVYALSLRQRIGGLELQLQDAVNRLDRSEQQVAVATRLAEAAQVRMAVLTAPDLSQVTLAGQPLAPRAIGRAFWSRSQGLVFAAADLPQLPPGRTYQLWYLQNPPVSAGLLKPDAAGRVAAAFDSPPTVSAPTGLAVSIEPEGGVPAPTGDIYLAGNTQ